MQTIIPYLAYEDAPAALTFLRDAFGFEERFRMAMEDGRIGHAEVTLGGSVLFLASSESSYITWIELFVDSGLAQI